MTTKCSVYIATSVDGFIARRDGSIDWLHKPEYATVEDEDLGYRAFIDSIDTLVMGRSSFEKVLTFETWPYEHMPVVVLSTRNLNISEPLAGNVRVKNCAPGALVSQLGAEGHKHLYIDGGVTIQQFLQAGLIQEITITQIPVLLGSGLPLFGSIGVELPLKHVETKSFDNGFVQTRHQVIYAT